MRAARVDANQAAIVAALRRFGAFVQPLHTVGSGCPDLLVGFRRQTVLLELKDGTKPPSARELTAEQVRWHTDWCGGALMVVTSIDEALCAVQE